MSALFPKAALPFSSTVIWTICTEKGALSGVSSDSLEGSLEGKTIRYWPIRKQGVSANCRFRRLT